MTTETAMILSGFLFWFVIITNVASERFGYTTIKDLASETKLKKISDNPKDFKISVALILTEHVSIIALAVMLFIAFGSYSLMLGIIWVTFRIVEALIQIYYKKSYWGLLDIARQYTGASGADKNTLIDLGSSILKTKHSSFSFAQVLFSIGTLAYSILFVAYEVLPIAIGWFGIVASILYGLGNGMKSLKPYLKAVLYTGALFILLFEIVLGGWLLFVHTIP
jgi:hypothetical protein